MQTHYGLPLGLWQRERKQGIETKASRDLRLQGDIGRPCASSEEQTHSGKHPLKGSVAPKRPGLSPTVWGAEPDSALGI